MKKFIPVILVVVVLVAAVSLLLHRKAQLAAAKPAAVLPVVVDTATLRRTVVTLTLPAMGRVTSDLSTTLSSKISGRVIKVYKQEGEPVRKGEKLARIDSSELATGRQALQLKSEGIGFRLSGVNEDVRALTLALAVARERHARTDQLLQVKGASIEEFRREEAEIAGLSAKLSAAQNSVLTLHKEQEAVQQNMAGLDALLSYATLLAPVSGTLSQRMVSAGDLAMPGKPLLRIAANHGLYLNLSLPVGVQPKEILYHGKKIPLTPKHQATPSGLAQYLAPLPAQSAVTEGQFLSVRVVIYDADDVLVPVDGLLSIGSKSFVFTMVDNQAWKEEVVIKGRGSEGVVVAADLAGKRIIVAKPDILLRVKKILMAKP